MNNLQELLAEAERFRNRRKSLVQDLQNLDEKQRIIMKKLES